MPDKCWFCRKGEEEGELYLDREFDTPVHPVCIRKALLEDPDDPEALLMKYLLEE